MTNRFFLSNLILSKTSKIGTQPELNSPLSFIERPYKKKLPSHNKDHLQVSLLKCSMCMEDYDGVSKKPRLLPYCGHNICEYCLKELLYNHKSFECSVCNTIYSDQFKKPSIDFPLSWVILDLLSKLNKPKGAIKKSNKCSCNKDATHYCRKHNKEMCGYCVMKHIKDCDKNKVLEICEIPSFIERTQTKSKELIKTISKKIDEMKYESNEVHDKFEAIIEYIKSVRNKINKEIESQILNLEEYAAKLQSHIDSCIRNLDRVIELEEMNANKLEDTNTSNIIIEGYKQCIDKLKLELDYRNLEINHSYKKPQSNFIISYDPVPKETFKDNRRLVNTIPRTPCKFIKKSLEMNNNRRVSVQFANSAENSKIINSTIKHTLNQTFRRWLGSLRNE